MKVCIPTLNGTGADDEVCEHFGSAPYFTILDTEGGEPEVIPNGNAHHAHGTCHPLSQLAGKGFEALVCGGMGRRALDMINAQGLKVYKAKARSVSTTLSALAAGELDELEAAHACGGHGHGSQGGHGHRHRHRPD